MNMRTNRLVDDFFEVDQDARTMYFRTRTPAQIEQLFPLLADDDRLRVTDALALEDPYRTGLIHHLAGFPQKGINSTGRTFYVEPTDKPVLVERGTRNNVRQFVTIDRKMPLPADLAINALHNFGPYAIIEDQRDLLREVPGLEPEPEFEPSSEPEPSSEVKESSKNKGKKSK